MGKCLQPGFPIWASVFNCRLLLFTLDRLFSPPIDSATRVASAVLPSDLESVEVWVFRCYKQGL
jgi:hypothetical protein